MSKQLFIPIDLFDSKGQFIPQAVSSHLQPFYFTFSKDSPKSGKYVKLWAENWDEAREKMNDFYGVDRWCFQYDTTAWTIEGNTTLADKHNLSETEIKPLIKESI